MHFSTQIVFPYTFLHIFLFFRQQIVVARARALASYLLHAYTFGGYNRKAAANNAEQSCELEQHPFMA